MTSRNDQPLPRAEAARWRWLLEIVLAVLGATFSAAASSLVSGASVAPGLGVGVAAVVSAAAAIALVAGFIRILSQPPGREDGYSERLAQSYLSALRDSHLNPRGDPAK